MAFGISASPLYCDCGAVTISASDIPTSPGTWGLFLFYKATYAATPFYSRPIEGDTLNPLTDSKWEVKLPTNATYNFYGFAIRQYESGITYGLGDWAYNSVDGWIYVSLAGSNTGNVLDNQIWWRKLDSNDYQFVQNKTTNVAATSISRATLTQNVTCNTSFLGLVMKMCLSKESSVQALAIKDKTGKFSFDQNPNGYGGVNPFRGDYAQMAIMTNTKSDGTFTEIQARPYNYRSTLTYRFDTPRDGLYVLNVFVVQLFGNKSSYGLDEAVFDDVSSSFYVSLANNNDEAVATTTHWKKITSCADFSAATVHQTNLYYFLQDNNARKLLYDLSTGIKSSCPCISDSKSRCGDDLTKKYMFVLMCIQNACFSMQLGRYSEAQCDMEKIPKNCAPYVSAYKC